MSHLAERHLFSSRYGLNDRAEWADLGDWQRRHKMARADASPISWCRCPGPSLATSPCGLKLTQEDGLCDECRQWCICTDGAGNLSLIAGPRPMTDPCGGNTIGGSGCTCPPSF